MTRILVVEFHEGTLAELMKLMPESSESVFGARDMIQIDEIKAEGESFDTFVVSGAMRDGVRGSGEIRNTLAFLRRLHQDQPDAKVFVLSGMFDHGHEAERYAEAFPGCQVFNKNAVLNKATILPI